MRLRTPLIVALAALPAAAVAQSASFRDWSTACSTQRTCWAFGFSPENADGLAFARIERGGAAGAEPVLVLAAGGWDAERRAPTATMRISVDGRPGPVVTARAGDTAYYVATLGDSNVVRPLIAALRNGRTLRLQVQGWTAPADVSLTGAAAALLWLDEQQKRVGTTTALARTGPRPASAVPPPPPARVVRAAASVPQGRLPTAFPAAMRNNRALVECREYETEGSETDLMAARLGAGRMLWGVGCGHGAYNANYSFFIGDEQGRNLQAVQLRPERAGDETAINAAVNPSFDARTMTLSAFAKGRGLGDCGEAEAWVWDGRAFVLVESQFMGECRDVPSAYWPTTVKADVRR